MYEKALQSSGLSPKQAVVYEACLKLVAANAPEIARLAGLKRTTVYGLIDELMALGLVSRATKGNRYFFSIQNPGVLRDLLDQKKSSLERVLPSLQELFFSAHTRPEVQFFEGRIGVKRIFEDTLFCRSKKICQVVRVQDFIEVVGAQYCANYIRRRAERGVAARAIHPQSGDRYDGVYGENSERFKRHVRYLPPEMFSPAMLLLYDCKVAMIATAAENFGFIIESKEFFTLLSAWFEFLWLQGSREPERS